jgi:SAM-dependent methyltransferase
VHGADSVNTASSSEAFAAHLREAEDRLRATGLSGRSAYAALCRALASRLGLSHHLWLDGPDAPATAHLDRIPLTAELDLFGLAYERFFPEVFKAERGQFFTPRPLVELMADLAEIRPGDRVLDPTAGSGTFMVVAHARGAEVDGIEIDPELVALCRLNLALHNADPRAVRQANLFRAPVDDAWDVILANPPFSVDIRDPDTLRRYALSRGRPRMSSDVLFLEAAHERLRPGGRLAVVLPRSILANPSYRWLRDWLDERFARRAIVSLPEGVFRPFGGTTTRAVVVVLQKLPARVGPWSIAVVEHPGYDPTRKVYRRTEPDELSALRIGWQNGSLPVAPAGADSWLPEAFLSPSTIGARVPTVPLVSLAPVDSRAHVRPTNHPDDDFTEIDLADVDKHTGEVSNGRAQKGERFRGTKTAFSPGDLLFARIRPNLNNVVLVSRPRADLPKTLCGSSEWVRMVPEAQPHFALTAARSRFVREQLASTGGQTRPRIKPTDLDEVRVPDPGPENRARIDSLVGAAHRARLDARRRLNVVANLYERFGSGEISAGELASALKALAAPDPT